MMHVPCWIYGIRVCDIANKSFKFGTWFCVGIGYTHKEWYIGAQGDEESSRGSEVGDGGRVHYEKHKVH